jgi:predicted CoA-substrate-specific enzyme activase
MRSAGIDIGSRSIKLIVLEGEEIVESRKADTGHDPLAEAERLLDGVYYDNIMATGYGRNLFDNRFKAPTVTEIKAHGTGAKALFPKAKAVLDIGGQDSKAILLDHSGKVVKFEMNDRCAAGTGKFLEIMARTLGYTIDEFGSDSLTAVKDIKINSMCTVFAESEAVSLVAKGEARREIARGLHVSIAKRSAGMLQRLSACGPILFSGGVANNPCMCILIKDILKEKLVIPEKPEMVGALGAAILASSHH